MGCLLIRRPDESIVISRGDGKVVKAGTWSGNDQALQLASRVVFRTVQRVTSDGERVAEPEVKESLVRSADSSSLKNDRARYVHLDKFDDLEFLALLAQERQQ